MTKKDQIRLILLRILTQGLLRIRSLGSNGYSSQCAVEADHLHILPEVLENLDPGLLRCYFEVHRPAFMRAVGKTTDFEPEWNELQRLIEEIKSQDGA